MKKQKCAIYCRVSTGGQDISNQKKDLPEFAESQGWEIFDIYIDDGVSGKSIEARPDFKRLLLDMVNEKFNILLVEAQDRITRTEDLQERGMILQTIKEHNIILFSPSEGACDLSDFSGELLGTFRFLLAAEERRKIVYRTQKGKKKKWKKKDCFIGKVPFGFRWNKEKKKLEIDVKEAGLYKKIVSMYVDQGLSYRDICIDFMDKGIKNRTGKSFNQPMLSYMLKNKCYYGHLVVNKYEYKDGKKTNIKKPIDKHITYKVDPIISKTRWDDVQNKIEFNKNKSTNVDAKNPYWLRDSLTCGHCGRPVRLHHGSKRQDGSFPRYYACYYRYAGKKTLKLQNAEQCILPLIKAKLIERDIWLGLISPFRLALNPKKLEPLLDDKRYDRRIAELENEIVRHEKEIVKTEKGYDRLYDLYEDGSFDKAKLIERLEKNQDKKSSLIDRMNEAKLKIEDLKSAKANDRLLQAFSKNKKRAIGKLVNEIWKLKPGDKKKLIETSLHGKIKIKDNLSPDPEDPKKRNYEIQGWNPTLNLQTLQGFIDEGKLVSIT